MAEALISIFGTIGYTMGEFKFCVGVNAKM